MELLECRCSGLRLGLGTGVDGVAAGGGGSRRAWGECAPLPLAEREGRRRIVAEEA